MKAVLLKPALPFLLLLSLLVARPAAAQQAPLPSAADSLAWRIATYTDFLTDVVRLSDRQRREVTALLARQFSQTAQPVPAAAWLGILSLQQYQTWQQAGGPLAAPAPAVPCAEVLVAGRIE